jgi:hypothetical protein
MDAEQAREGMGGNDSAATGSPSEGAAIRIRGKAEKMCMGMRHLP